MSESKENSKAVSNIVAAIISKDNVLVAVDNEQGVFINIPKPHELDPNFRSQISLSDLIKQVEKSFKE